MDRREGAELELKIWVLGQIAGLDEPQLHVHDRLLNSLVDIQMEQMEREMEARYPLRAPGYR